MVLLAFLWFVAPISRIPAASRPLGESGAWRGVPGGGDVAGGGLLPRHRESSGAHPRIPF